MNVRELIEELSRFDPEMEVGFGYTSSDYWRSTLVKEIVHVEPIDVSFSDYHNCYEVADLERNTKETKEVLTLSTMRLM